MSKSKIVTVLALFFLSLVVACSKEKQEVEEIIRPVRFEVITKQAQEAVRTFSGVAKAGTEIKLSFRLSGIIEKLSVKVGQKVEKGQFIAALDVSDLKLQHDETLAQLQQARVQRTTSKANLGRIRDLYENNNVSLAEYESAKNNYAAAKSSSDANSKRVSLQKRKLDYTQLTTPMSGYIGRVEAEANENVQAGQLIAVLNSGEKLEVEIGISESYIARIETGRKVKVKFPALPDREVPGVISEVSYTRGAGSSTYQVIITLNGSLDKIRPGMAAEVAMEFRGATNEVNSEQLFLPGNSVSKDAQGHYVFIVRTGKDPEFATVHRQAVRIGPLTENGFSVVQGVQAGDLVVTAGVSKITDGMKVRMLP